MATALRLGLGSAPSRALGLVIGATALGCVVFLARKRDDERRAFVVALVASILCSPIVWLHYYAVFIVALGLLRPRYGVLWVLPLLTVLAPPRVTGSSWWAVIVLASFAAVLATALVRNQSRECRQPAWGLR